MSRTTPTTHHHDHDALARLVAFNTRAEQVVSLPVGDAPYDLVVDDGRRVRPLRGDGAELRPGARAGDRTVVDASVEPTLGQPNVSVPRLPACPLPAPVGIRRANPREQGVIGFGDAVGWFGAHGFLVSIPLVDSQRYDLVVDDGAQLLRVQVKTATHRGHHGRFVVGLKTAGGNQRIYTVKRFDHGACELLYVLTDAGQRYVIPTTAFDAGATLTLGKHVARYQVR